MSQAFNEIKEGLEEVLAYSKGRVTKLKIHKPHSVDVKKLRKSLHMTQELFAASFGMSLGTLRHWERGDRIPQGAALVLLNVVEKAPETVMKVLAQA